MAYDSEATKRRLLDAAIHEFSEYGIMGARVEKIAALAKANKQAIYMYFGSKEGLFSAAFEERIKDFLASVQFDEGDLAAFAGRMFDKFEDAPDTRRLTLWYHLERTVANIRVPLIEESTRDQVHAIRAAQEQGKIPATYDAATLLGLVRSIALTWHTQVPQLQMTSDVSRDEQRRIVEHTVRAILV